MKTLYTNKCLQRLYTPLTYDESLPHVNNWYVRNKTAFNKSVIVIKSISNDGTVNYVEKEMKIINIIPITSNLDGSAGSTSLTGETLPLKQIMVDEFGIDSKLKKGRLVYVNLNVILGKSTEREIKLYVDKYQPYELTAEYEIYTVIMDGWSPYCATNLGKYGTWDLEAINKMKK